MQTVHDLELQTALRELDLKAERERERKDDKAERERERKDEKAERDRERNEDRDERKSTITKQMWISILTVVISALVTIGVNVWMAAM